jgi:hypothetical protein
MNTLVGKINALLLEEDVEGYIEFGAPIDEYASEAALIAEAIEALTREERTEETIRAVVALIWAKNFNLSNEDLALRAKSIGRIAEKLMLG